MRFSKIVVDMRMFLKFLEEGRVFTTLVKEGLPDNCKFCYTIPTGRYNVLELVIEHESFRELISGEDIPEIKLIFKRLEK